MYIILYQKMKNSKGNVLGKVLTGYVKNDMI